jgi:hypothetical protein
VDGRSVGILDCSTDAWHSRFGLLHWGHSIIALAAIANGTVSMTPHSMLLSQRFYGPVFTTRGQKTPNLPPERLLGGLQIGSATGVGPGLPRDAESPPSLRPKRGHDRTVEIADGK